MTDQEQKVGEGALAIQGGRDVQINQGMSASDVQAIISALGQQMLVPAYAQIARAVVEERLADFELKLLERFASDASARPEAFAEPDFQATVVTAQRAHARSGDDGVRDVLVDLIARRSTEIGRSRLSLSLNQAVEKAALLTHEEFAALSLCYLAKYTKVQVPDYAKFVAHLRDCWTPFVSEVPRGSSVFAYLQAQGCAGQGALSQQLHKLFSNLYAGVVATGVDLQTFVNATDTSRVDSLVEMKLLIPCFHDRTKWQVGALNKAQFDEEAKKKGLSPEVVEKVWSVFAPSVWDATAMPEKLAMDVPEMRQLFDLWAPSGLAGATLTSVGIAIAHASIGRRAKTFDANLSIWIK